MFLLGRFLVTVKIGLSSFPWGSCRFWSLIGSGCSRRMGDVNGVHTPWGLFTGPMAVEALGFLLSTLTVHSHCPGSAQGPARSSEQQNGQCTKHSENVLVLKTALLAILENSILNAQSMQAVSSLGPKRHRGAGDKGPHRSGLGARSVSALASGHAGG